MQFQIFRKNIFRAGKHTHLFLAVIILIGLFLGNIQTVEAQSSMIGPQDPEEVTAFLDGVMATSMENNHVPGAVVVVVKDGEVFFSQGYGFADLETKTPVDPAITLFRPGSVSKLFTWTAVMQLVEQGKLDLNADINTYLDFKIPDTFKEPITLKHIMTHAAGFEDKGEGLFKLEADQVSSLETYVKENIPARVFPPGQFAAYSNYATALSGYIVQRVSGVPFEAYIAKNILEPLGMEHATFVQPLPSSLSGDMASGYNYVNGEYLEGSFEFVVGTPAGALSASGLDMARFMIAHLQDGQYGDTRILKPETSQQMHSPLYSPDPRLGGMAYGFFYNTQNGQYTLSHGGDTMLFHSQLYLLPETNVGIFVSTNGTNGGLVAEDVIKGFLDHYYPPTDTAELQPCSDFASRASQYAGTYYMARNNFTTLEKILMLMSPINVRVDNEKVYVQFAGKTIPYVEVEPGYLVNPDEPSDELVLQVVDGQVTLAPPLPFVFLKAPWYATLPVQLLIVVGGMLLFLIALIAWLVSFIRGLKQHEKRPILARLARLAGGAFGLIFLVFMLSFVSIFTDTNPAFGVPNVFFNMPPGMDTLMTLPIFLAVLTVLMLVFTIVGWIKGYWKTGGRLFYTLLTLFALANLWALNFWNLL